MRKTLLGLGLASLALMLSGCGQQAATTQNAPASNAQPAAKPDQSAQNSNSAFSSLKDAMGSGQQLKCTYTTTVNGADVPMTAFIQGKNYRSTIVAAGKTTNLLFDGDTMHTWVDGMTTGMQIKMACINDFKAAAPQGQPGVPAIPSPEDRINSATNVSCVPSTDADFTVPATVTFTDQCAMLKKSAEMMKNLPKGTVPGNIPANVPNIPNY